MDRRSFLKITAVAPLVFLAGDPRANHPPLDKSWPLDTRDGFENNTLGVDSHRITVWLDGEKQFGVVAVDIESGHILKFVMQSNDVVPRISPEEERRLLALLAKAETDPEAWIVHDYLIEHRDTRYKGPIKIVRPQQFVTTRAQPCSCKAGLHVLEDGLCIPMEIKHGRIELRRIT